MLLPPKTSPFKHVAKLETEVVGACQAVDLPSMLWVTGTHHYGTRNTSTSGSESLSGSQTCYRGPNMSQISIFLDCTSYDLFDGEGCVHAYIHF
jgi:hypothetical protein